MKRKDKASRLHRLLSVCLSLGLLVGCASGPKTPETTGAVPTESSTYEETAASRIEEIDLGMYKPEELENILDNREQFQYEGEDETMDETEEQNDDQDYGRLIFTNAPYVLIYNPLIFVQKRDGTNVGISQSSGYFGNQIATGLRRAGGLDDPGDEDKTVLLSQEELWFEIPADELLEPERANGMDPVYKKGDKQEFYAGYENREKKTFTCAYAGKYCYIWTYQNSISNTAAKSYGELFDQNIYEKDVAAFGKARFTDNGGKINLLFYPIDRQGVLGFFTTADIYSSGELSAYTINANKLNVDHAIIHLSSAYNSDKIRTTMSHEFQHLICASDNFPKKTSSIKWMESWLNEAMSAAAEELISKGVLDEVSNRGYTYYSSGQFRNGQSLYNFDTTTDIGAYGAVYLYEEYLKKHFGEDIFTKVHTSWREDTEGGMNAARVLLAATEGEAQEELLAQYLYSKELEEKLGSDEKRLMSRLTLDFYLETLMDSPVRLDIYEQQYTLNGKKLTEDEWMKAFLRYRLYDSVNATDIEGGGSILIATENGTFYEPKDAGEDLIYVALDESFRVIGTTLEKEEEPEEESTETPEEEDLWTWSGFVWNGNETAHYLLLDGTSTNGTYTIANSFAKMAANEIGIRRALNHLFLESREDILESLRELADGSAELPGVVIVDYVSEDPMDEEYRLLLSALTKKGVFVLTLGDIHIDAEDLLWAMHFDYSGQKSRAELNKMTNSETAKNWGNSVAGYIRNVLDEQKPYILYFKK